MVMWCHVCTRVPMELHSSLLNQHLLRSCARQICHWRWVCQKMSNANLRINEQTGKRSCTWLGETNNYIPAASCLPIDEVDSFSDKEHFSKQQSSSFWGPQWVQMSDIHRHTFFMRAWACAKYQTTLLGQSNCLQVEFQNGFRLENAFSFHQAPWKVWNCERSSFSCGENLVECEAAASARKRGLWHWHRMLHGKMWEYEAASKTSWLKKGMKGRGKMSKMHW